MLKILVLTSLFWVNLAGSVKKVAKDSASWELSINMPGKRVLQDEEYNCYAKKVPRKGYATAFRPTAHMDRVHHMILFGCLRASGNDGELWDCERGRGPCASGSKILYAWARNAPALDLPDDVGAPVGFSGDVEYLVLQVHYAKKFDGNLNDYTGVTLNMIPHQPRGISAVYLFIAGMRSIPAHKESVFMNVSCKYHGDAELHPFAFRTHTHALGVVVSAARRRDQKWDIIGKRNPQWPQMFQKIAPDDKLVIKKGDLLAGQCRFNSTTRDGETGIGMHGKNEMCNFYMMFWRDAKSRNPFGSDAGCGNEFNQGGVFCTYPAEASRPLPPRPELEHAAHQSGRNFGRKTKRGQRFMRSLRDETGGGGDGYYWDNGNIEKLDRDLSSSRRRKDPYRYDPPPFPDYPQSRWDSSSSIRDDSMRPQPSTSKQPPTFRVVEKGKWTQAGSLKFGEISGFSLDKNGNIVVFHRGGRVWNQRTFTIDNVLQTREAIDVDTVVTVDSSTGSFISSWGKNRFYMPHGITVDSSARVWVTDVGLHQVLRFGLKKGVMTEERVWGKQFVPGNSRSQFCKPASVAVASDGSFFVADGYCNSRIVHFDKDGSYLNEYGTRSQEVNPPLGTFYLPHDIVLNENKNQLFVSDRENGRVQVLHTNGTPIYAVKPAQPFLNVYSSDYCESRNTIFMIPGTASLQSTDPIAAFAASPSTRLVTYSWQPQSGRFLKPHILRVSRDCRFVYVGEIRPLGGILWKFEIESDSVAVTPKISVTTRQPSAKQPKPVAVEEPKQTVAPERYSMRKVVLYLTTGVGIPALLFLLVCACLRFRKQGGGMRTMNMMSVSDGYFKDKSFGSSKAPLLNGFGGRSHKGFQPLSTEDIDGIDDLTDESDAEDTLYPPKRNFEPLKA